MKGRPLILRLLQSTSLSRPASRCEGNGIASSLEKSTQPCLGLHVYEQFIPCKSGRQAGAAPPAHRAAAPHHNPRQRQQPRPVGGQAAESGGYKIPVGCREYNVERAGSAYSKLHSKPIQGNRLGSDVGAGIRRGTSCVFTAIAR